LGLEISHACATSISNKGAASEPCIIRPVLGLTSATAEVRHAPEGRVVMNRSEAIH
jgi:hypothetical protein